MDASLFFSFSLFHSGRSSLAGIIMQKIPVRNSPRAPPPRCGRSYPPRNWRNSQRSRCIYTGSCSWPRYEVSRFSERLPAGAGRKVSYRIAARTDEPGLRGATRIDVTRTGDYRHVGWLIPSRRVMASRLHSYPESAFLCNPRTGYRNQVMTALWALARNYVWRGGNRRISGQPDLAPGCRRDSSPSHSLPLTPPLEN